MILNKDPTLMEIMVLNYPYISSNPFVLAIVTDLFKKMFLFS